MKKVNFEFLIKILISIFFIILSIITIFNIGKKFFELKNTVVNNVQKVNISSQIAKLDFKVSIILESFEVLEIE